MLNVQRVFDQWSNTRLFFVIRDNYAKAISQEQILAAKYLVNGLYLAYCPLTRHFVSGSRCAIMATK